MSGTELEETTWQQIDWKKLQRVAETQQDVIPAVAQDVSTGAVVMLAYVNQLALAEARKRGCAVFWSTSRNELWIKGATSGSVLELVEIRINCEQNSILYRVKVPDGKGACHSRDDRGARFGCYYRKLESDGSLSICADRGAFESD